MDVLKKNIHFGGKLGFWQEFLTALEDLLDLFGMRSYVDSPERNSGLGFLEVLVTGFISQEATKTGITFSHSAILEDESLKTIEPNTVTGDFQRPNKNSDDYLPTVNQGFSWQAYSCIFIIIIIIIIITIIITNFDWVSYCSFSGNWFTSKLNSPFKLV